MYWNRFDDAMTGDEVRIVVLDASGDIRPDDSRRATYTDEMRAYWDELQRWYRDHPGAIIEPSNELEINVEDNPGINEEARGL